MNTVRKLKETPLSSRQEAEELGRKWAAAKARKEAADADMKEIADKLLDYANRNKADFGDKKRLDIGAVQLVFVTETKPLTSSEFDMSIFMKKHPECVEHKLKVSTIKGLCEKGQFATQIADLGVTLESKDKFQVELSKKALK